jgi:hypothetical protein
MTYSIKPYSAIPYSSDGLEMRGYFDMTMDLTASLTLVIYVSTVAGFASGPSDALPNQPFRGVLESFTFQRSILQSDIGQFTTGQGTLVISNADAFYDFLPLSYAIDGRPITIKVGRRDRAYDSAFTAARVTASSWDILTSGISVNLVDFSYKLNVPLQPNVYGGTGDADGTSDMAGKRKPLVFGNALNISPVALVPSLLIYQCHDGSMQSIDAVYDRGAALTPGSDVATYAALVSATVASDTFATCLAQGLIKLGETPAGTVTADVKGENSGGYITRTADIVRWAVRNRTALADPGDLDVSSFTALNTLQPAPIDYFVDPTDSSTVAAFIQNIMGGIGGWGGHKLDGTFEVRIFQAPSGTPLDSFTRADMLAGQVGAGATQGGNGVPDPLQRLPLPDAYNPPPWRWRVPYARCWTVQTDLAGSVSADHKALVSQDTRLAEADSTSIQTDHPFAQDIDPIDAYFSAQSDAQAEAARRIDLFKTTRALYQFPVPRRALRRDIGDVILVTHPRFDLPFGRLMTIVETAANIDLSQAGAFDSVTVTAYG